MKIRIYFLIFSLVVWLFNACIEPYIPKTYDFKDMLVVECVLIDQLEKQKVSLSRLTKLEEDSLLIEKEALVWIEDSNANSFSFSQEESGIYLSDIEFKAEPNVEYKLYIKTKAGKEYESKGESLTPSAQISKLYANRIVKDNEEGVQISVDSKTNSKANYIRYEYEETYKIITPHNINFKMSYDYHAGFFSEKHIQLLPINEIIRECYTTQPNKNIIQKYAYNNMIQEFPIRFIKRPDYILKEGYSILLKQYVQTFEAHNYYRVLNQLGSVQSLLIENQTGFVTGNITSKNNTNDKVVGFFEVSSLSTKRIFIKYTDFYYYNSPRYPYKCIIDTIDVRERHRRFWLDQIVNIYRPPWEFSKKLILIEEEGEVTYYLFVNPECGNCTTFSSNIKPDFWED